MDINFRQGLLQAQIISNEPAWLEYFPNTNMVGIDVANQYVSATVCHRQKNYTIDERTTLADAWGPFDWNPAWGIADPDAIFYLYWDISVASGQVTRGFTYLEPVWGTSAPVDPELDQHWFDTTLYMMKVWDGEFWQQKIRVFAASLGLATTTLTHYPIGSQVDIELEEHSEVTGYILYGVDQKGVRDNDATFVTTASFQYTNHGAFSSPIRLELIHSTFLAAEPLGAHHCVTNNGDGTVSYAQGSNAIAVPIGISYAGTAIGDPVEVVTHGYLYSDQFNWDIADGKHLYCGENGLLVQSNTSSEEAPVKVGTIMDAHVILVHIDETGAAGEFVLEEDVLIVGTDVGAAPEGYTFPQGMTFTEFVIKISKKTLPPSYDGPSLTLSSNPSQMEAGTILSPILTGSFNQDDAGPRTAYRLYKNSVQISTNYPSYQDVNIQLTLSNIVYQAQADYADGPIKNDNMGNPNPSGQVLAGTATSNTVTFVGTRRAFYGTPSSTPTNSAGVRALTGSFNSSANTGVDADGVSLVGAPFPNFVITIPIGATRVVFAYPASERAVASVKYQELSDSEVKHNFTQTTVTVEGANGWNPVSYRVYTYIPVEPFSLVNHYKVFI